MYLLTRTPDPIIRKTQQRFKKDKLHKKQPLYLSISTRADILRSSDLICGITLDMLLLFVFGRQNTSIQICIS